MTNNYHNTIEILSDIEAYKSINHIQNNKISLPSIQSLREMVEILRDIFFPGYFKNSILKPESLKYYMGVNIDKVKTILYEQVHHGLCYDCPNENSKFCKNYEFAAEEISDSFISKLPEIREKLISDVEATFLGDPAAHSRGEVIFCYPGIRAITNYRIAHELVKLDVPLIPRIISEMAHSETGIDIHPEAEIGNNFCIDHGTGVVIGATCIIGNYVKIYQGVTLGAKSFPVDEHGNPIKGIPRHPILENNVVIYSGATILGRITIGKNSVIGGNVWVTNEVPANSKILQSKTIESHFSDGGGI
jgi:serine O-acetyltransferase